uniref:general transcription factor II-I repeat domain-containing protein 2B-like n=1 Tax=Pristiophorus japonicus TaxID=55135 RepID=UPI00398EC136
MLLRDFCFMVLLLIKMILQSRARSMTSSSGDKAVNDSSAAIDGCSRLAESSYFETCFSLTTDGSPNLTGKNSGLLKRIKDKVKEEGTENEGIFLHCIIHQEALCSKVLSIDHVVRTVVKVVNCKRARELNHQQFISLLEDTDAEHQDLLYHSNVRWLSLGKVLQRVWELGDEICIFLEMQGKENDSPELRNSNWVCDLTFGVHILALLNELNVKLQGKNVFVHTLYCSVKAFKVKLVFFSKQMKSKEFAHSPTLKYLEVLPEQIEKYSNILSALHGEFSCQFSDFEKIEDTGAAVMPAVI